MQIKDKGKYLGIYLGPGVYPDLNWELPIAKFEDRVAQIAAQGWPLAMIPGRFAAKALSVLGYIAQFQPPPSKFKNVELKAATKVFGFATNAFCPNSIYSLGDFEGPALPRPAATLHATRARAAFKTFRGYSSMHDALRRAHKNAVPANL